MMRTALVTTRPGGLAAFRAGLESRGFRVQAHGDAWGFLQAPRHRKVCLVILDGVRTQVRPFLERLLEEDAQLPVAVMTDLAPEAFQVAVHGLGVLCGLPAQPAAADVAPLLEKLRATGGLDPVVEAAQARLDALKFQRHPHCVVCWDRHPSGLGVDYCALGEGSVEGTFGCGKSFEGYEGVIHGGVVSSLLDGAMVSCLLAKGLEGYTADLRVRFHTPVATGIPAIVRGTWLDGKGPLHRLEARLEQDGKVCASARATFLQGRPGRTGQPGLPGAGPGGARRPESTLA